MKLSDTSRWVLVASVAFLLHATLSFTLPEGYKLNVCSDILQTLFLLAIAVLAVRNAYQAEGPARAFWGLMGAGLVAWAGAQCMWAYIEVVHHRPVPDPFAGDIVLFFHVVPMMAALAVQPHRKAQKHKTYLSAIDFSLLMLWWLYLYVFIVIPPQYVEHDVTKYATSFTVLYVAENLAMLVALGSLWLRTKNAWRDTYKHLFFAGALYVISSQAINVAIMKGKYYTGSIYDLPFAASLLWYMWVTAVRPETRSEKMIYAERRGWDHGTVVSRLAMGAILSMPALAAWSTFFSSASRKICMFRLAISLEAIMILAMVVFLKQFLLDRERMTLLRQSEENLENMQRLHVQLIQSEKLAALGQLVSGAAHEINNPLTAILGYAELLSSDPSVDETAREHGRKIKQQTRRTRELVTNLLRFARRSDTEKTLVNLNAVVENTLQLRALERRESSGVMINRDLHEQVGWVWADSTELMEVCFQLLGNANDALQETGGGTLTVRTRQIDGWVTLEVLDTGPGIADPKRVFDPFYSTKRLGKGPGLGLSACYGIVKGHNGEIHCENREGGGARFVVRLPLADPNASLLSPSPASKILS